MPTSILAVTVSLKTWTIGRDPLRSRIERATLEIQELVHRSTLPNQDNPDDKEPNQRWEVGDDCGSPASRVVEPRRVCWPREHRRNGRAHGAALIHAIHPVQRGRTPLSSVAQPAAAMNKLVIANAIDPL